MEDNAERKIAYRLEMSSREDLRPSKRTAEELEVKQVEIACPELNWFMHQSVGANFRWGGREVWGRKEWAAYVDRPELETWVAYVTGTPAGYYELERQGDDSVRIECFGLRDQFFGQGLGGPLLTKAIERCWAMGANRVWLSTCNHDHPNALKNYYARGFKLVKETTGPPNPQRESALFARSVLK
jgi:GNAT superfamily N-acetyltransferase